MLQSIPLDDRKEAQDVLESVGWETNIVVNLLQLDPPFETVTDFLARENEKKFLGELISGAIDIFTESSPINQHVLELQNITPEEFDWSEVEIEHVGEGEPLEDGSRSFEERTIRSGGEKQRYGNVIAIQGNKFEVRLDGTKLKITCSANYGRSKWQAIVPISIPFEDIERIGQDANSDFRSIKKLLDTDFKH